MEDVLLVVLAFVCGLGVERFVLGRSAERSDGAPQQDDVDEQDEAGAQRNAGAVVVTPAPETASLPESQPLSEGLDREKEDGVSSPDPEEAGSESLSLPAIYAAADRFEDFYVNAAHPGDFESQEAFRDGVALLRRDVGVRRLLWYAAGDSAEIAVMSLAALRGHPQAGEIVDDLINALPLMGGWMRYFALQVLADPPRDGPASPTDLVSRVLLSTNAAWEQPFLEHGLEEFIEKRIAAGEVPRFEGHSGPESTTHWLARWFPRVDAKHGTALRQGLEAWLHGAFDPTFLSSFGRLVGTEQLRVENIVYDDRLRRRVDVILQRMRREPSRSVVLVGEEGVGRSTALEIAKQRLLGLGWTVFEAGAVEILSGQVYIGELEGRVKRMLQSLQSGERVLWVIPSLQALSYAGRHRHSETSILDMVLPYIESGSIRVLCEEEPSAYERLAVQRPELRSILFPIVFGAYDKNETLELAASWARKKRVPLAPDVLQEAYQLAEQFLDREEPGRLLEFLQLTAEALAGEDADGKRTPPRPLAVSALLETLSDLTGLPLAILDERARLDLEELQHFFFSRVMGQPEAVSCLIERTAMIKAGVTDPSRPLGVYLFTGPTGTGKTELAKALAQFLFGSAERMIRVDMSEFQVPGSEGRLLRAPQEGERTGSLVQSIRQQPFSVVLLDEFEKAHEGVWDLFLQVFDDGRLADTEGNVADFRHAIIIMTSNLGAELADQPIGFGRSGEAPDLGPLEEILREVFRREFLNRLDRVVVFRPLGAGVMREILIKELDAVLVRRGLRNRQWAVEWDASALEFLLEQGFSTTYGARPLKRAIDRHLLAPLATTIVSHQVPDGDQFLFVRSDGEGLEVEFVDPDQDDSELPTLESVSPEALPLSCAAVALDGRGTAAEVAYLRDIYSRQQEVVDSDDWKEAKKTALDAFSVPEFWRSPERFSVLGAAEYRDRVEAGMRTAGSLLSRLEGDEGRRRQQFSGSIVQRLAQQLYLLEAAHEDVRDGAPADAFLVLESVRDSLANVTRTDAFAERLRGMYEGWAKKRGMHAKALEFRKEPWRLVLAVSGFAALRLLQFEAGEHVLEGGEASSGASRARVRITVAAQPVAPLNEKDGTFLRAALESCEQTGASLSPRVVRRYREEPSPLVRDGVRGWRTGHLERVLAGDFDLFSAASTDTVRSDSAT